MRRLLLAPAALCLLAFAQDADRSLAIFPRQEIPLRFTHGAHLAQDMKCLQCHDVDRSTRASDRNIPAESTCTSCHDIEQARKGEKTDPPSSCLTCHPGFEATAMVGPREDVFPDPNLKFDHALHLKKGVACETCHGDMRQVTLATRKQLPKMETCLTCHRQGGQASGRCSVCHLDRPDGTLVTLLPDGARLVPEMGNPYGVYHGPGYERTHGPQAMARRELCSTCHAESDCLACHAGTMKNVKVHPNDWITLHPVPAKMHSLQCTTCHNYQDFCVSCHARAGVTEEVTALAGKPNVSVHPTGWVSTAGESNLHALWASRDVASCAACHREETCIKCHATRNREQTGGRLFHPAGFAGRASALCHQNERVCLKCHAASDPRLTAVCP